EHLPLWSVAPQFALGGKLQYSPLLQPSPAIPPQVAPPTGHAISVQATPPSDRHVHLLHPSVEGNEVPAMYFTPLYSQPPNGFDPHSPSDADTPAIAAVHALP